MWGWCWVRSVADWLGDALSAIISVERDPQPAQRTLVLVLVLALGLLVALLWFFCARALKMSGVLLFR